MTKNRPRALPLGWKRRPLPDCPLCEGKGAIRINLFACDGSKENDEPLRAPCGCVLWPRPRGANPRALRAQLVKLRKEMERVSAAHK